MKIISETCNPLCRSVVQEKERGARSAWVAGRTEDLAGSPILLSIWK